MLAVILIAGGLSLIWLARALGPRYRSERSAFLSTVGAPPSAPAGGQGKPGQILPVRRQPQHRKLQWGLTGYVALVTALPSLARGNLPGVGGIVLAGLAGWALPAAWAVILRQRSVTAMDRAAGDLISHLRLQTAAGTPLLPALHSAPSVVREPLRGQLEQLLADMQVAPLPSALQRFARRCASAKVANLVQHLLHQQSLGVPLDQVFREEEQHYLTLAREEARQRIRSATLVMALLTFVLFMNGALLFATPIVIRAFAFLSE